MRPPAGAAGQPLPGCGAPAVPAAARAATRAPPPVAARWAPVLPGRTARPPRRRPLATHRLGTPVAPQHRRGSDLPAVGEHREGHRATAARPVVHAGGRREATACPTQVDGDVTACAPSPSAYAESAMDIGRPSPAASSPWEVLRSTGPHPLVETRSRSGRPCVPAPGGVTTLVVASADPSRERPVTDSTADHGPLPPGAVTFRVRLTVLPAGRPRAAAGPRALPSGSRSVSDASCAVARRGVQEAVTLPVSPRASRSAYRPSPAGRGTRRPTSRATRCPGSAAASYGSRTPPGSRRRGRHRSRPR